MTSQKRIDSSSDKLLSHHNPGEGCVVLVVAMSVSLPGWG